MLNENMALMSQNEIDTLVEFLTMQKEQVSNEVMDQGSIDRLIQLLRTDGARDVKYDSYVPEGSMVENNALILLDSIGDLKEQQTNCVLDFKVSDKNGFVSIVCRHNTTGKEYRITPRCMEQVRYIAGDISEWGVAVPPLTFDKIAALLSVKYSRESFEKISKLFAEKMYGDENASIAEIYMPTTTQLLRHME